MSIVLPHRGARTAPAYARRGGALVVEPRRPTGPPVGRLRQIMHRIPLGSGLEIADAYMVGPQPPILPLHVAATGDYNAVRSTPADGACGVHSYPCKHPGTDVGGVQGTIVNAPEDGTVTLLADGSSPPWSGYGPYLLLMLGKSGYYHLLAHLQPGSVIPAVGDPVTAGQAVATTSSANHTHWEVRKKPTPNYAANETNFDNNIDPVNDWLPSARGINTKIFIVAAGLAVAAALYFRKGR